MLCALVILKPQEFIEPLQGLPLLYVVFAIALVSIVIDIVWKRIRPALAPQLPFIIAFFVWGIITTMLKRPVAVEKEVTELAIVLCIVIVVAIGMGSRWGLRVFAGTLSMMV